MQTYTHTCESCIHTQGSCVWIIHVHIYACIHKNKNNQEHTTYIHTYIHTSLHIHTYKYIHTHIYIIHADVHHTSNAYSDSGMIIRFYHASYAPGDGSHISFAYTPVLADIDRHDICPGSSN